MFDTNYATSTTSTRKFKIDGLDDSADTATFEMTRDGDDIKINVADYFEKELNKTLKYPKLPVIRVGSKKSKKKMFFPMEMCVISEDQKVTKMGEKETSAIIKKAALPGKFFYHMYKNYHRYSLKFSAPDMRRNIEDLALKAIKSAEDYLNDYNIDVDSSARMAKISNAEVY